MAEKTHSNSSLSFAFNQISAHMAEGIVTIDSTLLEPIQERVLTLYSSYGALPGFADGLPADYLKEYFAKEVKRDTEQFLFRHFVLDFLMAQLIEKKVVYTNWPRLDNVTMHEDNTMRYRFILSQAPEIPLKEWKHFIFKQPKRKNYKDLDKQVSLFLKSENDGYKKQDFSKVEPGDWVNFELQLLDQSGEPLLPDTLTHSYWLHMTEQPLSSELQQLFTNRSLHERFTTTIQPLQGSDDNAQELPCVFGVFVKSITKGSNLCVDFFKNTFKLKTRADTHKKLIEVFSYRDDISQRRSIIEELFHLLFTKHRFEVPKHIITRKKELILNSLRNQPDYHVYKGHKSFTQQVESLAEKLLKEEIIMDHIAFAEGITVTAQDIASYVHMFNNERLKEFIYFRPMIDRLEETDTPIHHHLLSQAVLREKTLNHIIHILS
ncbi:MAG: hypothetical protein PVJ92_00555 [Candidatus Dependentiae bacterium]